MAIRSKSVKPVSITNESGEPEIVLQINGLTLSMNPPNADGTPPKPASVTSPDEDAPA